MPQTTIRVQYQSSGKPTPGYRVTLSFTSALGGVTGTIVTDAQGIARIDHASVGEAKVIVQGTTRTVVRCPGEYTVTV